MIDLNNKRVTVIGAARSGSAVAKLLRDRGAHVFISDKDLGTAVTAQIPFFQSIGVDYEFGKHTERIYQADLFVISPGVPSNAPVVVEAASRGIKVVSELEAASWFCPSPIVAVTGSNGKTTTTTLTGRMFADAGKPHLVGGNIGLAFSALVPDLTPDTLAVLEVSSFQLDHIEAFHPKVAVIMNITPDHLDRYGGSFEAYQHSKGKIFLNQTTADYLLYCYDDEKTRDLVSGKALAYVRAIPFGMKREFKTGAYVAEGKLMTTLDRRTREIIEVSQISIKGIHNLYNSMAATLAAQLMGVSTASIRGTLRNFKGVEHRLEFVRELNGVRYINDSKATNVDSVKYGLMAYPNPIILFLGGRDKGNDYSLLNDEIRKHVKAIIAIGESAGKVQKAFENLTMVVQAPSMKEAVERSASLAVTGDIVLLSPACASFDWFDNYEHRGKVFKQYVGELREL